MGKAYCGGGMSVVLRCGSDGLIICCGRGLPLFSVNWLPFLRLRSVVGRKSVSKFIAASVSSAMDTRPT